MDKLTKLFAFESFKKRHVLAIHAFFGYFVAYSTRSILSVAIIDMANETGKPKYPHTTNETLVHEAEWSPILQGYILSSFFYGYIITQIPAGYLTSHHGGKIFFGFGNAISSLLCVLTPILTLVGPNALIVVRILQGMAQGVLFTAMHCLWSNWSPPTERSRLSTFALSGSYIGSVLSMLLGGIIGKMLNWQSIFYIFGFFGLIWSLLWFLNIHETPTEHKSITQAEKNYIESSLPKSDGKSIPWSNILKSIPLWAIVVAHTTENWGFYTMLTKMPTFFADILQFRIDKAGIVSSLPYLAMTIILFLTGYISDKLIEKQHSYSMVRKIFACLGLVIQAIFMICIVVSTNQMLVILFVTFAIGFGGMAWGSFSVNILDIGGRYANVLMSISNTIATIPGIVSPVITGYLTTNKTKLEWNNVFYISAVMYFIGAFVFLVFATGRIQKWAVKPLEVESNSNGSSSSETE